MKWWVEQRQGSTYLVRRTGDTCSGRESGYLRVGNFNHLEVEELCSFLNASQGVAFAEILMNLKCMKPECNCYGGVHAFEADLIISYDGRVLKDRGSHYQRIMRVNEDLTFEMVDNSPPEYTPFPEDFKC